MEFEAWNKNKWGILLLILESENWDFDVAMNNTYYIP